MPQVFLQIDPPEIVSATDLNTLFLQEICLLVRRMFLARRGNVSLAIDDPMPWDCPNVLWREFVHGVERPADLSRCA